MGRYVGNKWVESLPSSGSADQVQGNNVPVPSSNSGGGGGGGGAVAAPTTAAPSGTSASGEPMYMTPNGPKTVTQMNTELAAAGWPGPPAGTAGAGATANAYAQTTGGAVTEMTGQNYGASAQNQSAAAGTGVVQAATGSDADVQRLIAGINSLLSAQASGNKDAINEAIREFNANFGLDTQKFQDDIRRFNQNFAVTEAGLTGTYNGAPTLQAQNQAYTQQMGMINAAAALQANPFRQQQVIGQMGRLLSGQGVAGFAAPNTVAGVGTAGGNTQGGLGYLNQMIKDIQDPGANQASMNDVLNAIPTPTKMNSVEFFKSAPSTQNLVLQGMQEKYGLDPGDALNQLKQTLPGFQAPQTFGTVKKPGF